VIKMSKRIKHVFSSSYEVAHVWASRSLDFGNNGTYDGNCFFTGDTIYSYGHHFPIAKFHKMPNGQEIVLFNSSSYSVSTSRHQGEVRSAIPDFYKVVSLPAKLWFNYKAGRDYYIMKIKEDMDMCSRAREYAMSYLRNASAYVKMLHNWGKLHRRHPRYKFTETEIASIKRARAMKAKLAIQSIKRNRARICACQLRKIERQLDRQYFEMVWKGDLESYWRSKGELPEGFSMWHDIKDTLCRIVDDEVVTSKYARVPVEHAKRILPIVKICHDKQRELKTNDKHPVRIGYYEVQYISADGDIKIGCHDIKWSEVEILGQQLLPELFKAG
jgi:hypothetical protein